jgi:hypothetical protein
MAPHNPVRVDLNDLSLDLITKPYKLISIVMWYLGDPKIASEQFFILMLIQHSIIIRSMLIQKVTIEKV